MFPKEGDCGIVVSGGGDTDQEVVSEVLKIDTCLYDRVQFSDYGGIIVAVSVDGRRFGCICGLWDGGLVGALSSTRGSCRYLFCVGAGDGGGEMVTLEVFLGYSYPSDVGLLILFDLGGLHASGGSFRW